MVYKYHFTILHAGLSMVTLPGSPGSVGCWWSYGWRADVSFLLKKHSNLKADGIERLRQARGDTQRSSTTAIIPRLSTGRRAVIWSVGQYLYFNSSDLHVFHTTIYTELSQSQRAAVGVPACTFVILILLNIPSSADPLFLLPVSICREVAVSSQQQQHSHTKSPTKQYLRSSCGLLKYTTTTRPR